MIITLPDFLSLTKKFQSAHNRPQRQILISFKLLHQFVLVPIPLRFRPSISAILVPLEVAFVVATRHLDRLVAFFFLGAVIETRAYSSRESTQK